MNTSFSILGGFLLCIFCITNAFPQDPSQPLPILATNPSKIVEEKQSLIGIGGADGVNYFAADTRLSWTQSLDFCHQNGLRLARVKTVGQATFLGNFLSSGAFLNINFFYLSGADYNTEGQFWWVLTGEKAVFTRWASGHPVTDNTARSWNCVAINKNGFWQNQNCGDIEPQRYVLGPLCEV